MTRTIDIGGEAVTFSAMAVVDKCFWDIFHEDPMALQTRQMTEAESVEFVMRMGFVMAQYAALKSYKEMKQLTEDDYGEWLSRFPRIALISALPEIQAVYNGQSQTATEAKKNNDAPSAG